MADDRVELIVVIRVALAGLLMLASGSAVATAEVPPQATGKFVGRNWNFPANGAYAFPAEVGFDDEIGVRVAVSNAIFRAEILDRDWDRQHMIDTFFKDEETLVVYFHFAVNGTYEGMSYYFESGDGCGFCYDGSVKSTVAIDKGRIRGRIQLPAKEGESSFDLTIDVPIAPSDYGAELPAGGGELGEAYAGYHATLVAGDNAAAKVWMTDENQVNWAEEADQIVKSYWEDHPGQSYAIVRAFVNGERGLLLVHGETSYGKVKTEVQLVREKGTWRIETEELQIRMGDD